MPREFSPSRKGTLSDADEAQVEAIRDNGSGMENRVRCKHHL
jgi:hypothetical protein